LELNALNSSVGSEYTKIYRIVIAYVCMCFFFCVTKQDAKHIYLIRYYENNSNYVYTA